MARKRKCSFCGAPVKDRVEVCQYCDQILEDYELKKSSQFFLFKNNNSNRAKEKEIKKYNIYNNFIQSINKFKENLDDKFHKALDQITFEIELIKNYFNEVLIPLLRSKQAKEVLVFNATVIVSIFILHLNYVYIARPRIQLIKSSRLEGVGIKQINEGDYIKSLDTFNKAITLNPKNPRLFSKRALVLYKHSLYEFAAEDFSIAYRLNPDLNYGFKESSIANYISGSLEMAFFDLKRSLNEEGIKNSYLLDYYDCLYKLRPDLNLGDQHIGREIILQENLNIPREFDLYDHDKHDPYQKYSWDQISNKGLVKKFRFYQNTRAKVNAYKLIDWNRIKYGAPNDENEDGRKACKKSLSITPNWPSYLVLAVDHIASKNNENYNLSESFKYWEKFREYYKESPNPIHEKEDLVLIISDIINSLIERKSYLGDLDKPEKEAFWEIIALKEELKPIDKSLSVPKHLQINDLSLYKKKIESNEKERIIVCLYLNSVIEFALANNRFIESIPINYRDENSFVSMCS